MLAGVMAAAAIGVPSLGLGAEPATRPASIPQDWPAFHGGGPLTGEAAPIQPPPMRLRWTYRTDGPGPILAAAAIVGAAVYVADEGGTLHAIDLNTGKRIWAYEAKQGFETTPLVLDGRVLLGDLGGTFHAVCASDGHSLWTLDAGSPIHSSANALDDRILFGDDGHDIYCLQAADGKQVWRRQADDRINGTPAVAGTVYVSGCDAVLRGLAPPDGALQFTADLPALCPGSPAVVDGRIVLGTDHGCVLCFDQKSHKQLWVFDHFDNKAMVYSSPAVSAGIVVVGAQDRSVRALDLATGAQKWSFATRGDVDSSPVISDGRVYVGSKDKRLYVLDLQTGRELWKFNAGRAISASPAVGRGVVVVGDEGGSVYCLEPASPTSH
jgi:outer membrane protein assembly factor BamB